MQKVKKNPTEPLKCWKKAKEMAANYNKKYMTAKDEGKILWSGSAFAYEAIVQGIGDNAHFYSEPYAATLIAGDKKLARECREAHESKGFAHDLCSYCRTYFGSMFLNKSLWGEFPKPEFEFTTHICCSHAKWAQQVAEYEGIPSFAIDPSVGPYAEVKGKDYKIDYVAGQLHDAIEWLEKICNRKYDDEKLFEAIHTECKTTSQ